MRAAVLNDDHDLEVSEVADPTPNPGDLTFRGRIATGDPRRFGAGSRPSLPDRPTADEVGFFVSTDGEKGYFASNSIAGSGGYDIFVAKYDNAGHLLWANQAGGPNFDDYGLAIAVDGSGNCFVTGAFSGQARSWIPSRPGTPTPAGA